MYSFIASPFPSHYILNSSNKRSSNPKCISSKSSFSVKPAIVSCVSNASSSNSDSVKLLSSESTAKLIPNGIQVEGVVTTGFGRGSKTLGVPTANLDHERSEITSLISSSFGHGVYCGWARVIIDENSDALWYPSVINYGMNPTFGDIEIPLVEAHVMNDFEGDFYSRRIQLCLVAFLRQEMKFNSFQELIKNIKNDIKVATAVLANQNKPTTP
uniref:riboflavin kinase n=1 Tax=Timspurckia oligopyrenoides TaxID=708627 RepID=A0A7S0ZH10_9RHOD|mmetsp:Transcript_4843/g.8445  ORF Transcript_4843/g.8445 Transcript_4843/m.8445 type:complete len:214 (+) Transcript_4843:255-896(+)